MAEVTLTLYEDDARKIIANALCKTTGRKIDPEQVSFIIGTKTTGYGMAEHEVPCLEKITVTIGNVDPTR